VKQDVDMNKIEPLAQRLKNGLNIEIKLKKPALNEIELAAFKAAHNFISKNASGRYYLTTQVGMGGFFIADSDYGVVGEVAPEISGQGPTLMQG